MQISLLALLVSLGLVAPAAAQTKAHNHGHSHSHAKPESRREAGAHTHGNGTLNIAIDGQRLLFELRAPGADIVGFEGKAATAEAKTKQAVAVKKLEQPLSLFTLPATAQCNLVSAKAIIDLHDDQAAKNAEAHSDFEANYEFTCAAPDKLTTIELPFFKTFPGTRKLAVQLVTPKGQGAIDVASSKPKVDLGAIVK